MGITLFSLKTLILFIPGIISFVIIDNVTNHKETKNIHRIIYSMVLSFSSYMILYILSGILEFVNYQRELVSQPKFPFDISIHFWDNLQDVSTSLPAKGIIEATIISIILGIIISRIMSDDADNGIWNRLLKFFRSKKNRHVDILTDFFNHCSNQYVTVTDWEKQIMVTGKIAGISDCTDRHNEIFLFDAVVKSIDGSWQYPVSRFYLSQNLEHITIELFSDNESCKGQSQGGE